MAQAAKYKILHELGTGGMGKVYKGLLIGQAGFQRPIVMKQLRNSQDPAHVQLFVDEARRYAVLDHENIGRIFDFDRVNGEMCIILEYIDGTAPSPASPTSSCRSSSPAASAAPCSTCSKGRPSSTAT